jgi:alpha-mannosidase
MRGDYASQNVASLMNKARVDDEEHVKMTAWSANGMDKPTFQEAMSGLKGDGAKVIKKGHVFGPTWSNHWVKVDITIPEEFKKGDQQVLCE